MITVLELLLQTTDQIKELIAELLMNHSLIRTNSRHISNLVIVGPTNSWNPLGIEGKQLRSHILEDYRHYYDLIRTLLSNQPKHSLKELEDANKVILEAIEQSKPVWVNSTSEAMTRVIEAFQTQVEILKSLYDGGRRDPVFVPDTNALIYNPSLEDWNFPGIEKFILVLTPTVLNELDQHKVNHRNEEVRRESEGLIKRVKGYRARGRLTDGVPLRSGKSTLVSIATEPDFDSTLPWLDPNNADDRYLASFIEVMRKYSRSATTLVTCDINLQNKAEFSRLPFCEPPEI